MWKTGSLPWIQHPYFNVVKKMDGGISLCFLLFAFQSKTLWFWNIFTILDLPGLKGTSYIVLLLAVTQSFSFCMWLTGLGWVIRHLAGDSWGLGKCIFSAEFKAVFAKPCRGILSFSPLEYKDWIWINWYIMILILCLYLQKGQGKLISTSYSWNMSERLNQTTGFWHSVTVILTSVQSVSLNFHRFNTESHKQHLGPSWFADPVASYSLVKTAK